MFREVMGSGVVVRWVLVALWLVTGCGGGSSAGSGSEPTPTMTTALPQATDTATPPGASATPTVTASGVVTSTPATPSATPETSATPLESSTPTPDSGEATATPSPPTGELTATPTPTHPLGVSGPLVTYLGIVRADGCRVGCFSTVCICIATPTPIFDDEGREVFLAQGGGRGLLVVEGRPGGSSLPVGIELVPSLPELRPDLQIVANRPLGNGSPAVCDRGLPPPQGTGGGIPAVADVDFDDPSPSLTDALNDFACRFAVQPSRGDACTLDARGNFDFVSRLSTIQFCNQVASIAAFPPGDTLLTVRLLDVAGAAGPPREIVVRNPAGLPLSTPVP